MRRPIMSKQGYAAIVAKMLKNHGRLDAAELTTGPFAEYVARAFEWGMTPVRASSNIISSLEKSLHCRKAFSNRGGAL